MAQSNGPLTEMHGNLSQPLAEHVFWHLPHSIGNALASPVWYLYTRICETHRSDRMWTLRFHLTTTMILIYLFFITATLSTNVTIFCVLPALVCVWHYLSREIVVISMFLKRIKKNEKTNEAGTMMKRKKLDCHLCTALNQGERSRAEECVGALFTVPQSACRPSAPCEP